MKLKETYYFVGRCLGLRFYPDRKDEIIRIIHSGEISFEKLVWVISSQHVMPTFYVLFRDADMLGILFKDLVEHMAHIHKMNTMRNELILRQIDEINTTLANANIYPTYLKGTAHLLNGMYSDIGERMIGDIDFMLPLDQIYPAVDLLKESGYNKSYGMDTATLKKLRHHPRLIKEKTVAAIEIHHEVVHEPYRKSFNFEVINELKVKIPRKNNIYMPCKEHRILFNIMHCQMNDMGYSMRKIFLRQMYDLFLLSREVSAYDAINEFGRHKIPLHSNLALAAHLLHKPDSLKCRNSLYTRRYVRETMFFINHQKMHRFFRMRAYIGWRLIRYFRALYKALISSRERMELFRKVFTRSWRKQHFGSYKQVWNV